MIRDLGLFQEKSETFQTLRSAIRSNRWKEINLRYKPTVYRLIGPLWITNRGFVPEVVQMPCRDKSIASIIARSTDNQYPAIVFYSVHLPPQQTPNQLGFWRKARKPGGRYFLTISKSKEEEKKRPFACYSWLPNHLANVFWQNRKIIWHMTATKIKTCIKKHVHNVLKSNGRKQGKAKGHAVSKINISKGNLIYLCNSRCHAQSCQFLFVADQQR